MSITAIIIAVVVILFLIVMIGGIETLGFLLEIVADVLTAFID